MAQEHSPKQLEVPSQTWLKVRKSGSQGQDFMKNQQNLVYMEIQDIIKLLEVSNPQYQQNEIWLIN